VFCDLIIARDKPLMIWDMTNNIVSFEPLNPVVDGHRLFVPRKHITAADSDPMLTGRVFEQAALWAGQHKVDYNLITSGGRNATQSVFHLHVHYVPRSKSDGLTLPWTGQAKS
jgi:histidine triad (HIT) family protein